MPRPRLHAAADPGQDHLGNPEAARIAPCYNGGPMDSSSRERVLAALGHREPDRVPIDFGGSNVTGMHVSAVAALRRYYGLGTDPVKVSEPGQMLGEIGEDLRLKIGIDVQPVIKRGMRF